jgi:hypothetical protein
MNDQVKIADKDRPRPRLGDKAIALASRYTSGSEQVSGNDLEQGIAAQEREITDLNAEIIKLKSQPIGLDKQTVQLEFDHLYHDMSVKIDSLEEAIVGALNGVRLLLNVFGSDLSGDDVARLIQDTNEFLDRAITPIAVSREEAEKRGRIMAATKMKMKPDQTLQ